MSMETLEHVVLAKAMEAYDGASNGNRTRGGMKKASDMWVPVRPPHLLVQASS